MKPARLLGIFTGVLFTLLLTFVYTQRSYVHFLIPEPAFAAARGANFWGSYATFSGTMKATQFMDNSDPTYYLDPAGATSAILAGNVGIGTTSPGGTLELYKTGGSPTLILNTDNPDDAGTILFQSENGNTLASITSIPMNSWTGAEYLSLNSANDIAFRSSSLDMYTAPKMILKNSGNVGIGTTGPGSDVASWAIPALDISGSRGTAIIRTTNAAGIATLRMTGPGAASVDDWHINMIAGASSRITFTPKAGSIGDVGLTLLNNGNVGIGTTNPDLKLTVNGDIRVGEKGVYNPIGANYGKALVFSGAAGLGTSWSGDNSDPQWMARYNAASNISELRLSMGDDIADDSFRIGYCAGFADFNIGCTWNPTATFTAGGNVGIGTTAPASKLSVGGAGLADYAIYGAGTTIGVYGVGGTGGYGVYGSNSSGGGMWGIGSAGATGVRGDGGAGGYDFYAGGAGTDYGTSSSIRWKTDLQPIDHALDKVLALRGLYYTWDEAHGGQHGMGMIAEDVGKVVPEIVGWDPDAPGYATGMDYGHLTPVLVEAIKGLNAKVDNQVASLQSITTDFITQFKAGLIETKKLIVDGVDVLKKLNELSGRIDKQEQTIRQLQTELEQLKAHQ